MKKKLKDTEKPASMEFLEILLEEGHVPRVVVIGNKESKKVKKSEKKT